MQTLPRVEKLFADLNTLLELENKDSLSESRDVEIPHHVLAEGSSQPGEHPRDAISIPVSLEIRSSGMRSRLSRGIQKPWVILGFYLLMITLAEVLTTALHQPIIGLFVHGLVMIGLVSHASLWTDGKLRRGLIFLALIPLTRLMSLAMPLSSFPRIYWYPIIGAPLLLAAALAAHQSEIGFADIGLVLRKPILQILVGLCGVGLGYAEYKILRPEALITQPSLSQVLIPAIILTLFTGVLEEVLFRGMLQPAVCALLGKWSGLIFTALLFAVMHLGYLSVLDVAFVFAVGLVFGWIAQSTGSIFGVILAHSLTNIGLFLFFPFWN